VEFMEFMEFRYCTGDVNTVLGGSLAVVRHVSPQAESAIRKTPRARARAGSYYLQQPSLFLFFCFLYCSNSGEYPQTESDRFRLKLATLLYRIIQTVRSQ